MLLRVIASDQDQPKGAILAPSVALVMLEGPAGPGADLGVRQGGRHPAPPFGTIDVGTEAGPARIAAFRLHASVADRQPVQLAGAQGEELQLYPDEFDPDPLTIAAHLDQGGKRKLLDFLVSFCAPAFGIGRSPGFAQICARLAAACAQDMGTAAAVAQVLPDHMLVGPLHPGRPVALVVIGRSHVTRSRMAVLGDGGALHLLPNVEAGDQVIAMGPVTLAWTITGTERLPHILAMSGTEPASVAARLACRRALAGTESAVGQELLRDLELMFPMQPVRLVDPTQPLAGEVELAVPDCGGGLFLAGWLRDPLDRVQTLVVSTPETQVALPAGGLERVRRPDVEKLFAAATHGGTGPDGFVLHLPDFAGVPSSQPHLLVRLKSGAEIRLTPAARSHGPAAARDAVLGSVQPGQLTPAMMRRCLAPAAGRLHQAAMTRSDIPEIVRIGPRPPHPAVSVIVPLYRNLAFIRFQLAALAEDPDCRAAEVIFVLDSPEQRSAVEHLLRGLYRLTDMPVTLVVMPRNLGYAAACNAGACVAGGSLFLLLNSDVVPAAPGWLATMAAHFDDAAIGAVGPKLLFDDGSIQHAGLFFERDEEGIWFNRHYHKGMPRHWPDAALCRQVPGVTGAALLVRRALYEQVGGICEDYIIGDYEDSDFCLRLGDTGAQIRYVPEAELFHFERRSIRLHQGYARTHAALYNRLLHHDRWDRAMDQAMAASVAGPAIVRPDVAA